MKWFYTYFHIVALQVDDSMCIVYCISACFFKLFVIRLADNQFSVFCWSTLYDTGKSLAFPVVYEPITSTMSKSDYILS